MRQQKRGRRNSFARRSSSIYLCFFLCGAQVIDIKIFVTVIHLRFPFDNGIDNDTAFVHPFMPHRIEHTHTQPETEF